MDGDQVGESPADDPAIPEWVSDPITWVARPSMPRGYIAAETAACVVVAFDIMRILRDNAKIRSEISVGPSLETWDLVDNGMTDRVWHPDHWWDELETGRNGASIQLQFRKGQKWLKPLAQSEEGDSIAQRVLFLHTPMEVGWPLLEKQSRAISAGARMAFQAFQSDLSDGRLSGKLINADDGDLSDIPLERWDTGAFATALWTGGTAKMNGTPGKEPQGRLAFDISEFESYLSARDGQSWQFSRSVLTLKLAQAEGEAENEIVEGGDEEACGRLPPYLNYMLRIWRTLNLEPEVREKKEWIEDRIREHWLTELGEPSKPKVSYMATFLRNPRWEVGGAPARGADQKGLPAPSKPEAPTV